MDRPRTLRAETADTGSEEVLDNFDLNCAPGFLFRQLDARATALFSELSAQSDITPRQFGVLLTLHQHGSMPQTELGKKMRVDRSTLGEMLQRMFERGLVQRSPSEVDRRVVELAITQLGREILSTTASAAHRAQQILLEPLPANQRHQFLENLSRLAAAWQINPQNES